MTSHRPARRIRRQQVNDQLAQQDQQHPSSKLDDMDARARDLDEIISPVRQLIPLQTDRRAGY